MFIPRHRFKQIALLMFIAVTAWLLTAYGANRDDETGNEAYAADSFAMGTVISQKVYGVNGKTAADEAVDRIRYLDKLMTFNESQGDVYRLNQNAGVMGVEMDPATMQVIKKAQEISAMSNGAFDITVGPLVKAWKIGTDQQHIPSQEELNSLLPLINYEGIRIDNNVVTIQKGQMVDLGGIAKGYVGDEVIEIYKKHGVTSAVVNLGGNVVTLGNKPDGTPWRVAIRNPRPAGNESGQDLGIVKVTDKAVVTAGDDQRYFIENEQRYHHILDPTTGYPAKSDLMSVTLITDSSLDADALDTAVYILGFEKGRQLISQYGGVEAVFVTTDKKVYVTEGLKDSFEFLGEGSGFVYQQ